MQTLLSITLTPELKDSISNRAHAECLTRSALIRKIFNEYLEQPIKKDKSVDVYSPNRNPPLE